MPSRLERKGTDPLTGAEEGNASLHAHCHVFKLLLTLSESELMYMTDRYWSCKPAGPSDTSNQHVAYLHSGISVKVWNLDLRVVLGALSLG